MSQLPILPSICLYTIEAIHVREEQHPVTRNSGGESITSLKGEGLFYYRLGFLGNYRSFDTLVDWSKAMMPGQDVFRKDAVKQIPDSGIPPSLPLLRGRSKRRISLTTDCNDSKVTAIRGNSWTCMQYFELVLCSTERYPLRPLRCKNSSSPSICLAVVFAEHQRTTPFALKAGSCLGLTR